MSINLLPQVDSEKIKKKRKSIKRFILLGVWLLTLILIGAILFFFKGYQNAQLIKLKTKKINMEQKILALEPLYSDYFNIAYKTEVLNYVQKKRYSPKVMYNYIDNQIGNLGTVSQYEFDAKGDISLIITADSYENAMFIWHKLLENPDIITSLNLSSFNKDKEGKVHFTLKGQLNLDKLNR